MSQFEPAPPLPPTKPSKVIRGFNAILGLRIVEWRDGLAHLEVDLADHHLNGSAVVDGGVLATLLDAA